ncbi:MAG: ParA family protein [Pseudonocardiaceae bacterium]
MSQSSFGGVMVRVVHDALGQYNDERRRSTLLRGIEDLVETAELLTSEEERWYGSAFNEDPYLPLWAEALARPEPDRELLFASDLDADLTRPAVATFYSLRGGVGRTTALVSAARTLASRGRRVLCIDMDLEAPGLSTLLGLPEQNDDKGSVSLLLELERGEDPDIRDHIQRVADEVELYCLPAGRVDAVYAERLRLIDPEIWYRESANPLHRMLDLAAESSLEPDIILLDARTGISPANAPLLFDVSDLAVVCFFPHLQARRGTGALVGALLNARSRRSHDGIDLTPEPRFLISPLPPGPSAARVAARALEWIEEWLAPGAERRSNTAGPLIAEELVHAVSYSPEVAFRDTVSGEPSDWPPYSPVVDWLEQLLPIGDEDVPSAATTGNKPQLLDELRFSTGAAETQETLVHDYVITRVSSQALSSGVPLVIGRKGTGKTALFRWLLETANPPPVPICCPQTFLAQYPWVLGADGFSVIEGEFENTGKSWRSFWPCYIALALYLGLLPEDRVAPPERFALDVTVFTRSDGGYAQLEVVDALRAMLAHPDAGLLAARWLQDCSERQAKTRLLLFDGLDTGFGGTESRTRRARAVEGLLGFSTEIETRLPKLAFKIMLRADIWQQLRFDNKSHLFGRSVQLVWRDQADYFKTVLKQAVRSQSFSTALESLDIGLDVAEWENMDVFRAWNFLVGERMKGGKTTFTRNWVWNRLADGQGDHGPRSLSQLFHEAVAWEKAEELRNQYSRSIVRPRALVPSLDVVSDEALQALVEEFPELETTVEALRRLGRTPVDARDLTEEGVNTSELELAREIGLLAIYEGTVEDVRRYRVPDLYRRALGLTRKGQA